MTGSVPVGFVPGSWYTWGVAEPGRDTSQGTAARGIGSLADTVQFVKDYARQETLDPLKGAGRWIALGLVGSIAIGLGTALLALGLLRLVQTEWPGTFGGRWTHLLPYLFALVVCLVVAGLAFARINKQPLGKVEKETR